MTKLHGILVTYQRSETLHAFFASLEVQSRHLDSLIIIDNDPDESARDVAFDACKCAGMVDYVACGINVGPAGGIARGMERVLRDAADCDWIITFDDDDPPPTSELLEELVRFGTELRQRDPALGGVGVVGSRFDPRRGRFDTVRNDELKGAVASSAIGGGNLPVYSVAAVRDVGLFDERLFFGFEELDYGLRMLDSGHRIYAHGELWHRERARHGRLDLSRGPERGLGEPDWRRYYSIRNLLFILIERKQRAAALRVTARYVLKPVANLHRSPRNAWHHLSLSMTAIGDAWRCRMGQRVVPVSKESEAAS